MARGFGSTFGASTADKVSAASLTTQNIICCAAWFNRNGAGGASFGRVVDHLAFNILYDNTNAKMGWSRTFATTSGGWDTNNALANSLNSWVHILVVHDASSSANVPTFYVNGVAETPTTATAAAGVVVNSTGVLGIGNRDSDGARNWDGRVGDVAVWAGVALTRADAQALYTGADPATIKGRFLLENISLKRGLPQSLRNAAQPTTAGTKYARDRQDYSSVNVFPFARLPSGAAYTLNCTTGAFVLAGTATGLRAARKLVASTGASTLTGSAAGLRVDRRIAAANGAITLTGQAAVLRAARNLSCATGSFALTGTATGLRAARKLTATTSTFALTGYAAALVYVPRTVGYTLTAATGTFSLTGNVAALRTARRLAASAGAFSLTGVDVILAKSGSFTTYPLAGVAQPYPRTGTDTYPLAGITQPYPLRAA